LNTVSATTSLTQDQVSYYQQKSGLSVEYQGVNGTVLTQQLSGGTSCPRSQVSGPTVASPLLPISGFYYAPVSGEPPYSGTPTAASVESAPVQGENGQIFETGVCAVSPGQTVAVNESLAFSIGSNALTANRVFARASIPVMREDEASGNLTGTLVYRRAGTIVSTWSFTLTGPDDTPTLLSPPIVAGGFDQLEIQVDSPSSGQLAVIGPTTVNGATAVPTFYLAMPPAITSGNAATFTVGSAGTFTVTTSTYPEQAASSLSETGTLPSGVGFVDNGNGTATLSGTPAAGTGGSYPITITASNGALRPATQSFTLTVDQAPAITTLVNTSTMIATTTPTFTVGTSGSYTVSATGFPLPTITDSCPSDLPSDLTFTSGTGTATLTGSPAAADLSGSWTLCVSAANGVGTAATVDYTVTINEAPAITAPVETGTTISTTNPTFTVGDFGSFTVTATGDPLPTITDTCLSDLPDDLTFTPGTGTATVTGSPAATDLGGTYQLCVNAANGVGTPVTMDYTVTIDQAPVFTSAANGIATPNASFDLPITATGTPPPTFSLVGAPPCVTIVNPSTPNGTAMLEDTGAGCPESPSSGYQFTIDATNTIAGMQVTTQQSFTLDVATLSTSGTNVTASITLDSGGKIFSGFSAGTNADNTEYVELDTQGTSTFTATIDVDWMNLPYCVPYSGTSVPTCQPTTVTFTGKDGTPTVETVLPCDPDNLPSVSSPGWCSMSEDYTYVDNPAYPDNPLATPLLTNDEGVLFGSGDLTVIHG